MKQSFSIALGGMAAALSLALLASVSIFPMMEYALPAATGVLVCLIVIELNKKWAFAVYATVSVLSLLILFNKEVSFLYVSLFGYYPIVKAVLESRLTRWQGWLCKLLLFFGSVSLSYFVLIRFLGVKLDDMEQFGRWSALVLLGLGSIAFVAYDIALTQLITLYLRRMQRHFRRIFRVKFH